MNDMSLYRRCTVSTPETLHACIGGCHQIGKKERMRGEIGFEALSTLGGVVTKGGNVCEVCCFVRAIIFDREKLQKTQTKGLSS